MPRVEGGSLTDRASRPRLVGRARELAALVRHFDAARHGRSAVVVLGGEPGIGKTRLLDAFAERSAQDGARVLRGGASNAEGMPPYLPFLTALGGYVRTAPLDDLARQS